MPEERGIREESANGAIYTSLGHRPRKTDQFILVRAESPFYSTVLPIFIVRAFSPYEERDTYPGATLRLPQAGINPRRWRSTAVLIWGYSEDFLRWRTE
jgi:hypothetical protein